MFILSYVMDIEIFRKGFGIKASYPCVLFVIKFVYIKLSFEKGSVQ